MTALNKEELRSCRICPVKCGTNRFKRRGQCGADADLEVASWNLHFGEEPIISGKKGSGTIFFSHCPLRCVFCQNYPISHLGNGQKMDRSKLKNIILELQAEGAANINLVTPTHYLLHVVDILKDLKPKKLKIPVVYNCSGYERPRTLRKLKGLVDIYMPDAKFFSPALADKFTSAKNYPEINIKALREMFRQAPEIKKDKEGMLQKGMIVRHLVLPGYLDNSREVLKFLSDEFGSDIYLSLMAQYHPAHLSKNFSNLNRRLTEKEYRSIVDFTKKLNFKKGYYQDI